MLGDGKTKLTAVSPYEMTLVMARRRNKDVALTAEGADGEATGGAVVVNIEVETSVLDATVKESESEMLRLELAAVPMAGGETPGGAVEINVNVEVSVLGETGKEPKSEEFRAEVAVVLMLDNAGEDEVGLVTVRDDARFVLGEEEMFVLGINVTKVVDEMGTTALVGGALDKLDKGIGLDTEMGVVDDVKLDVRFKLSVEVTADGTSGVEPRLAVAEDVLDDEETRPIVEDGNDVSAGDDTTENPVVVLDKLKIGTNKLELLDEVLTKMDELGEVNESKVEGVRTEEMAIVAGADGTEGTIDATLEILGREPVEREVTPGVVKKSLGFAEEGVGSDETPKDGDTANEPLELASGDEEVDGALLDSVGNPGLAVEGSKELDEGTDSGAEVDKTGATVELGPDVGAVKMLETVEAPGPVERFGKETVKPSLRVVDELRATDEDSDDKVEPGDEANVGIDGCTLRSVRVRVVRMLELTGKAGLDGAPEKVGTGVLALAKVLVMIVVAPPGKMLVSVVVTLEVSARLAPDVDPGISTPDALASMLVIVVVGPPEIVLVSVVGKPGIVGVAGPGDTAGITPLSVVIDVLVSVVADPPGTILVVVISTVEVMMDETPGLLDGPGTIGGVPSVMLFGIEDGTMVVSNVDTVVESPSLTVTILVDT
jgi:hypothetical protein